MLGPTRFLVHFYGRRGLVPLVFFRAQFFSLVKEILVEDEGLVEVSLGLVEGGLVVRRVIDRAHCARVVVLGHQFVEDLLLDVDRRLVVVTTCFHGFTHA